MPTIQLPPFVGRTEPLARIRNQIEQEQTVAVNVSIAKQIAAAGGRVEHRRLPRHPPPRRHVDRHDLRGRQVEHGAAERVHEQQLDEVVDREAEEAVDVAADEPSHRRDLALEDRDLEAGREAVEQAIEFAKSSPEPAPETLLRDVYA